MLKWFGRALYVMMITLLSLQVYSYSYYSKLQEYYTDVVADHVDDDAIFLKGINTLMGIDYYRESPVLYEYIKDDGDFQLTVRVYAIGIMSDDAYYDGYMIFVNDVVIVEDGVTLVDPVIQIAVELDHATLLVNEVMTDSGSITYDSQQAFAYYNVPVLFLFDAESYLKIPDEDAFSNLTRIEVSYSNRTVDEDDYYVFDESPLFIAASTPISESAYNKDSNLIINANDYRLRDQFADDIPNDAEITSFNLITGRDDLSDYNGVIWRTMAIYAVIVVGITYLLFFHKKVREHYKTRNYGVKTDGSNTSSTEPIFKDAEYTDKDGK
ncbi:MAG: hypothetical protein K9L02_00305 [Acholeplasmataceae bacterium]|nr:hypothetical protein [Acholeplasmataceae bacterium]